MMESFQKQEILIVDDEPVNIKALAEAFRSLYRIRFATNGRDAIKIANSDQPPDLVLLDIRMPDMDGFEVCSKLKTNAKTKEIPVIFISAKNLEEDETRGLKFGAADYVTKPFSLPIIQARVQTHLELKRQRDMLENLSVLDNLTGIPNRRYLDQFLNLEWRRSVRKQTPLSAIMVNIDHFKKFNDRYGHAAGNTCLQCVATALVGSARRPAEFVTRCEGELFVAILPETDSQSAAQVAENMRKKVAKLDVLLGPVKRHVTISLGVVTMVPQTKTSHQVLLETANKQLNEAREEGHNRAKILSLV